MIEIVARAGAAADGAAMRLFAIALVAACARPAPVARGPVPLSAAAVSTFEEAARAAGVELTRCKSGEGVILTTLGQRDATVEETHAFLLAHRPPPKFSFLVEGIDSSGFGHCCIDGSQQKASGCIFVEIWEDSPAVATLPAAIARAAPETKLSVGVRLMAVPQPRCSPGVPCPPTPYEGSRHTPRPGPRHAILEKGKPLHAGGRCTHDRECEGSCGCGRYDSRERLCAAPYFEQLRGSWCGCVDGSCAWFR